MPCPNCGFDESEAFCRKCGTRIDGFTLPPVRPNGAVPVRLICPHCEQQHFYSVTTLYRELVTCLSCQTGFETRVVKIRAKTSRGNKQSGSRDFTVRIFRADDGEELIQFSNAAYADFELRSGDSAVFSYIGPFVRIVQNLTINQYLKIKVKKAGCYIATFVYGEASFEVALLRSFRDRRLVANRATRMLVEAYYLASPIAIKWLGTSKLFRVTCRGVLKPIISLLRRINSSR